MNTMRTQHNSAKNSRRLLLLVALAIPCLQGCQTDPCADQLQSSSGYKSCQDFQRQMATSLAYYKNQEAQKQAAYDASSEGQASKRLTESLQNLTQTVQTAGNQMAAQKAEQARQQQAVADSQARARAEQQRQAQLVAQQRQALLAEQERQANVDKQARLTIEREQRNQELVQATRLLQEQELQRQVEQNNRKDQYDQQMNARIAQTQAQQEQEHLRQQRHQELADQKRREYEARDRAGWELIKQRENQAREQDAAQQRQQQQQIANNNAERRATISQSNALVILSVEQDGTVNYSNNTPYPLRFSFDYRFECVRGASRSVETGRHESGASSSSRFITRIQVDGCTSDGGRAVNISVQNLQWRDAER